MLTTMCNLLYDFWRETWFYSCQSYERIYKFTMDLIPHDWKHLLKNWNLSSERPLLRYYTYPHKDTRKVKGFHKTSTNKEIYFTFQSNSTKQYNKLFKFISLYKLSWRTPYSQTRKLWWIYIFLSGINLFNFFIP